MSTPPAAPPHQPPPPRRRSTRLGSLISLMLLGLLAALVPVSPANAAPPVATFTATVTDTNLVTLSWTVSGGSASNLLYIYDDIGFKPIDCTPAPGSACSHAFRAGRSGTTTYTLSVRNDANEFTTIRREATVDRAVAPPTVPARVHVDRYNPTPQTLSWSHPAPIDLSRHWVKLTPPGAAALPTNYPVTGTYTVPTNQFGTWNVAYCTRTNVSVAGICSPPAQVTYVVGPAEITGDFRRFTAANQPVTLNWSGSGTFWHVSSATLGFAQWTSTPSITIPANKVTNGIHDIHLVTCVTGSCSNREDVRAPFAGTVDQLVGNGQPNSDFLTPLPVASVAPDGGGAPQQLSTALGTYYHAVTDGAHVNANDLVGYVLNGGGDHLSVIVGPDSTANFTKRSVTTDFDAQRFDTWMRPATGSPLDITIDSAGDVWEVGEFGWAAARVSGSSLTEVVAPSGRLLNPATNRYERTKPFANPTVFGAGQTTISALVERVIDTGTSIWWAQGGNLGGGANNHSRLIRFDRNGTDNPATPDDDRVCAVHLPGVDQQVTGLAHDPVANRIWYAGKDGANPDTLGWFDEASLPCNNDLAYQQRTVVNGQSVEVQSTAAIEAAAEANRCDAVQTTGCIHLIPLNHTVGTIGHVTVDNAANALWLNSSTGGYVSKFPLNGTSVSQLVSYPLPTPIKGGWFASYPWQIRTDAGAVYLNEYADSQLVRLDKAKTANPAFNCLVLVAGKNPCMSEVTLPMGGADGASHSIALRNGKLWFTMSAEATGADTGSIGSHIGYVDTASWAAGAPTGVLYDNFAALGLPSTRGHWSFRGIEVSSTGRVVLAEPFREIVILDPT